MKSIFSRVFGGKPGDKQPEPVIIVSGLPRSGTSLMMNMLQAGGLEILTDQARAADDDNPLGYFELERVKQLYKGDTGWLSSAPGKVVKVISTLLPYLPDGTRYQIVFMRREMAEILASQKKMLANRGENPEKISPEQMAQVFEKNLQQVEGWMEANPSVKRLDVNYNQLVREPGELVGRINLFLGGKLDTGKMLTVIKPDLYRQRAAR